MHSNVTSKVGQLWRALWKTPMMSFSVVFYTMKTMSYIHCYLSKTTMVTSCDADATIASSHPVMTNATLFTDKYINIVTKCLLCNLFGFVCSPLSLDFCSIAFWQFPINEYVMLCYVSAVTSTLCSLGWQSTVEWPLIRDDVAGREVLLTLTVASAAVTVCICSWLLMLLVAGSASKSGAGSRLMKRRFSATCENFEMECAVFWR